MSKAKASTLYAQKGYITAQRMPDDEVKKHLDAIGDRFRNPSGITPLEYKVLVKPIEETGEITLKSGFKIYKPDETKERDEHASMEGEVIAISPLAFSYEQGAPKPSLGDRVVFARYSGTNIKGNDGISYRLMNDKDVIAIRTGAR